MMITKATFETYRDDITSTRFAELSSGKQWDGRAAWQPMKQSLSDKAAGQKWSPKVQSPKRVAFFKKVMSTLDEADIEGNTIELNHFLLQCVRIPVNDEPSPRKIMQVALNIGQLEAEIKLAEEVPSEFMSLYREFVRLGMKDFEAYV